MPAGGWSTNEERLQMMYSLRRWLIAVFVVVTVSIWAVFVTVQRINRNFQFSRDSRKIVCHVYKSSHTTIDDQSYRLCKE